MYDLIIVGAGMAGLTAAIYARRSGLKTLILEQNVAGGAILTSETIKNFPGFAEISGADLMKKVKVQAESLGAEIKYEKVLKLSRPTEKKSKSFGPISVEKITEKEIFKVKTNEATYSTKTVILAIGTIPKKLGLSRENEFEGHGISYCATCDGALYKDKVVAVVGGGNSALYETLYLANIAKKVYLIHRRSEFRGDKNLVDQIMKLKNVECVMNAEPIELLGEDKLSGLKVVIKNSVKESKKFGPISFEKSEDSERILDISGLFVAIGSVPATEKFEDFLDLDEDGFVLSDETGETDTDGLFVAGDCHEKPLRQLLTAAADGATAASSVLEYLEK